MNVSFFGRISNLWNAFKSRDPTRQQRPTGSSSYRDPDRPYLRQGFERSIVTSLYNRIAVDCSEILIRHVTLDENEQFIDNVDSGLNSCLTLRANIDQSAKAFIQDVVISMLNEGSIAIVPTDTSADPRFTVSYEVLAMRTGMINEWFPKDVRVNIYNDNTGSREDLLLPKRIVAVIENPFYSVMNETSSVTQRLVRKLDLLDAIDKQSGSGKMDIIVKVPYAIKSESKKKLADLRRQDLEDQMVDSKYGVGYIDSTEEIIQLNRPAENNIMAQIEYLTEMLYSQLGVSKDILNGSADDKTMINYYNQIIVPITNAVADGLNNTFITKNARSRGQSIKCYRDPFKFITVTQLTALAESLTKNEVASSNDIRKIIGWRPSNAPSANELRNKTIAQPNPQPPT